LCANIFLWPVLMHPQSLLCPVHGRLCFS
jgi:hypothetical protein